MAIITERVAEFSVHLTRLLDQDGHLLQPLPDELHNEDLQLAFYRHMVFNRLLDQKCIALQRTGLLGTYPSCLGQEALGVAIGMALHHQDIYAPYYRNSAALLLRGVTTTDLLTYWGGDESASAYQDASPTSACHHDFPVCIPIATQCCHAVGAAIALKSRQEKSGCA